MYSNISARVGKMLYPQNKLQDMEMEDQDYKRDWMTTVTSEEFRRDYFNRPRVNVKGKGHRLQSKHRTKIKNEIEKKLYRNVVLSIVLRYIIIFRDHNYIQY